MFLHAVTTALQKTESFYYIEPEHKVATDNSNIMSINILLGRKNHM